MKNVPAPIKTLFILFIANILFFPASAQSIQYRDPLNPERGYWKMITDATTSRTTIKFFDGQKNQIYEETLPGKYIKLTDRNIEKINKTFDQIAGKNLVMDQVKSSPLSSAAFRKLSYRNSKKKNHETGSTTISSDGTSALKVNAFQLNPSATFELNFINPDQERIIIDVIDKEGQIVHHESSGRAYYQRRFNFNNMDYGNYKLVVTTANRKYKYTKQIQIKSELEILQDKLRKLNPEIQSELANR